MLKRMEPLFEKSKDYILLSISIIFLIFISLIYWKDSVNKIENQYVLSKHRNTYVWWDEFHGAGEILPERSFKQTYITEEKCSGISLRFTTLGHAVTGDTIVKVYDNNGNIYLNNKFPSSDIADGEFREFYFDNVCIADKRNPCELIIVIATENTTEGESITVMCSNYDTYPNGVAYINEDEIEGDLVFGLITEVSADVLHIMFILIVLACILADVVLFVMLKKGIGIEKVAFTAIIFFGVLSLFVNPHKSIPDEDAHYHTAYRWSNCILLNEFTINNRERISPYLARQGDRRHWLVEKPEAKTYMSIVNDFEWVYSEEDAREWYVPGRNVTYGIFPYLISSLIIALCRILKLGLHPMLFLARASNLLFYATGVYFAIKIMPVGKKLLLGISCLPLAIQQAASFSSDGFVNTICFVFVSYIMYLIIERDTIEKKHMAVLFVLLYILAPCKVVYIALVVLVLALPGNKFKHGNQSKIFYVVLLLGICCVSILINIPTVVSNYLGSTVTPAEAVEMVEKQNYGMSYLFKHPLNSLFLIANTLFYRGQVYIYDLFGGSLQWSSISVGFLREMIIIICVAVLALFDNNGRVDCQNMNRFKRFSLICFVMVLLMIEAVFLIKTPYGTKIIEGVAGRYFIPILPLFFCLFTNNSGKISEDTLRKVSYVQLFIESTVILLVFICVIAR